MASKVTNLQNMTPKGPWLGVDGRLWRHTIGRFSNAVRVPINLCGSVIQALKILGKTAALPVTYSIVGIHSLITEGDSAYTGSMSLKGIAIDGVGFLRLIKSTGICFKNVIVAPHIKSQGFLAGSRATLVVIGGGLQKYPKIYPVSQLFNSIILGKKNRSPQNNV